MNNNGCRILIADDEPLIRKSLYEILRADGYSASMACDGEEALDRIEEKGVDIVITDIKMPRMNGMELLKKIKSKKPHVEVIMITGYGNIEDAVEAMRLGAFDYVTKPIVDNEIKIIINKIIERNKLIQENCDLRKRLRSAGQKESFHNLVGAEPVMQKIYNMIEAIANSRATVLLTGASGTGKRLVAQAIHANDNSRKANPFIEVSCGALPETLLESELFGHVKGSFTGAIKDRKGRFELADGGTIFLDEIDTFSPVLQVKLLRILQDGEFERVGGTDTLKVNVRIIAASNQRLEKLIRENRFREDLYYRLNVISVDMPDLKNRKQDIKLLAEHFIQKYNKENPNKKITGISSAALDMLEKYDWPGNVRELENAIERAMVLTNASIIDKDVLPDELHKHYADNGSDAKKETLKDILKEPERDIILKALSNSRGNKQKAAKELGINRATLYNKLKKYRLVNNESKSI